MAGNNVVCPHCRTKVAVPKDAAVIEEAHSQNQIPASRTKEDASAALRGKGREGWEVGNKPIGGDLAFREKLNSTTLPELRPGVVGTELRRANFKRRRHDELHRDFDDPEAPQRRRRRKERTRHLSFADTFVRGLVIAVILMTGVAGWMGWKLYKERHAERKPVRPTMVQSSPDEEAPGPDGPRLERRSPAEYGPALRDVVARFTSAKTVDEILPLVRDRERLEPKIRAYYSGENPWKPIEIRNNQAVDEAFAVEGDFIVLTLSLANFDDQPISLERKGDSFLVDWESFTGYGEMSWQEFMEERPRTPVLMRVIIEKGPSTEYFNGPFPDASTHSCYQLRDMSAQHQISGYVLKNSALDGKIRKHLQKAPAPAVATLRTLAIVRVSYTETTDGPHQVAITDFLENGWVFRPDN